jgi:hypothetical protein
MVEQILHRKLKIEQHEPQLKSGINLFSSLNIDEITVLIVNISSNNN